MRVVVNGAVDQRSVDDGELAQRLHGGRGDERHIGELDAVLLLEAGLLALAQAHNARHVHLVDGVDVGADAHALHHALGNDGAHLGQRHLRAACGTCGAARLRLRLRCGDAPGAVLAQVAQHIFLGDAALRAGAGDLAEVEVVLLGDAAHQRRGALHSPCAASTGTCGEACLLVRDSSAALCGCHLRRTPVARRRSCRD